MLLVSKHDKEVQCQRKRYDFLNSFKFSFHLMKTFFIQQKQLLDRTFVLSAKLSTLETDNCTNLPYPKDLRLNVKVEILHALSCTVEKINQNVQQLSNSFKTLRQRHHKFLLSSKAVEWDNNSRLFNGSATEKPLSYYTDNSFVIMHCLEKYERLILFSNHQLNIRDIDSIISYSKVVPISQNFYDLITEVLLNSYIIDKTEGDKLN